MTAKQLADAYKRVFSGKDGELVLRDLLAKGGVFASMTDKTDDPVVLAALAGRRDLAIEIATLVGLKSEEFIPTMIRARKDLEQYNMNGDY